MEAVRARHTSLPTEKQAKNRDEIVRDKAGGGERKNRSGRQAKIDGGETSLSLSLSETTVQMVA